MSSKLGAVDWNQLIEEWDDADVDVTPLETIHNEIEVHGTVNVDNAQDKDCTGGIQIMEVSPRSSSRESRYQSDGTRQRRKPEERIRDEGQKMKDSPPSETSSCNYDVAAEDEERDVLDLYCNEMDLCEIECYGGGGVDVVSNVSTVAQPHITGSSPTSNRRGRNTAERRVYLQKEEGDDDYEWSPGAPTKAAIYKRPTQNVRKQRRRRTETQFDAINRPHQVRPQSIRPLGKKTQLRCGESKRIPTMMDTDHHGRWTVRWVRNGYEHLLYDICNCNETPSVVFAGLCHQQSDVYTMVLRNCDGKRRYWYDKVTRRRQLPAGVEVSDFERAMRWRSNAVGRTTTSPAYDLAAFVLQNVATDKRCGAVVVGNRSSLFTPSIIVVTTDDMLTEPSMYRQLVYQREDKAWSTTTTMRQSRRVIKATAPTRNERHSSFTFSPLYQKRHLSSAAASSDKQRRCCCVCRGEASIVTNDTSGIPSFTCWQHASSYLADACADSTRVCNTAIVDVKFLHRDDHDSQRRELVCILRLVTSDDDGKEYDRDDGCGGDDGLLTIAELVFLPFGTQVSEVVQYTGSSESSNNSSSRKRYPVSLETAHTYNCRDVHYNHEDMFPSMPVNRGGRAIAGLQLYDTTIGRVVDRLHCVTSAFQKTRVE